MSPTLHDMIGQMILVGFPGTSAPPGSQILRDIERFNLGGVWLTDNDSPLGETLGNIASPQQLSELTQSLQRTAKLPLFVAVDAEGGQVIRLKPQFGFLGTKPAAELGRLTDIDRTRRQADAVAGQLAALGINFNFAPVLDLDRSDVNPSLGGKGRCFSADPTVVTEHGRIVLEANRRHELLSAVKHFPGHGSSRADSHRGPADVSNTWSPEELQPFGRLICDGLVDAVMTSHIRLDRYDREFPATLSKAILSGLLRGEMGHDGLIISDDLSMGAIAVKYSWDEAITLAIHAGVDVVIHANILNHDPALVRHTHETITRLVRSAEISPARIAASYERIVRAKARMTHATM